MKLGPDEVRECPACHVFVRRTTIVSGNTFGMRRFTDGWVETPMLPRQPRIVKCPGCSMCFWLLRSRIVGHVDRDWCTSDAGVPPEWRAAERVCLPDEQDYYRALRNGLANGLSEERDVRIEAWWRSNDPARYPDAHADAPHAGPGEREANLRALIPLLDESESQWLIMKAEALRELSRFDEALALLDRIDEPALRAAAARIRTLCVAREASLKEL
ncbi:MAG: hypothetical protein IT457_17245 [Planctomycetes bacterium]|nr:hypothetical protein [Planctomycetota bacterium]